MTTAEQSSQVICSISREVEAGADKELHNKKVRVMRKKVAQGRVTICRSIDACLNKHVRSNQFVAAVPPQSKML